MVAPTVFRIDLDHPVVRPGSGQPVTGTVTLQVPQPLSGVRALRLLCKGTAKAKFSASEAKHQRKAAEHGLSPALSYSPSPSGSVNTGFNNSSSSVSGTGTIGKGKGKRKSDAHAGGGSSSGGKAAKAKHVILATELTLWGSHDKGLLVLGTDLPAGTHTYPFSFTLPATAPPTLEGSPHGRIRYKLRAYLDRVLKSDYVTQTRIAVQAPPHASDPSVLARYLGYRVAEDKHDSGFWCLPWNRVNANARVECERAVVDPNLPVPQCGIAAKVWVDAGLMRWPTQVRITLVRNEIFKAEGRTLTAATAVAHVRLTGSALDSSSLKSATGLPVSLVSTDQSLASQIALMPTITQSDVVRVEYALAVEADITPKVTLRMSLPVYVCANEHLQPATGAVPASMLRVPGTPALPPRSPSQLSHTQGEGAWEKEHEARADAKYREAMTVEQGIEGDGEVTGEAPPAYAFDDVGNAVAAGSSSGGQGGPMSPMAVPYPPQRA